jgi:uncharacterized membrane protein
MSVITQTPSTRVARRSSYGAQISAVLVTAFALSATHTTYAWFSDLSDPRFTVTTPVAWAFYIVGFMSAFLARSERRWAQRLLTTYVAVLLWVSLFFYPSTFTVRQQTTFGWFENDVYTGLLMVAAYLCFQRLRRVNSVCGRD